MRRQLVLGRVSARYRRLVLVLLVAAIAGIAVATYSFLSREFVAPGTLVWRATCDPDEDFDPDDLFLRCVFDDDLWAEGGANAVESCRAEGMRNQSMCQGSSADIRERGGLRVVEFCATQRRLYSDPERAAAPDCVREAGTLFWGGPEWEDLSTGAVAALGVYAAFVIIVGSVRILAPRPPGDHLPS